MTLGTSIAILSDNNDVSVLLVYVPQIRSYDFSKGQTLFGVTVSKTITRSSVSGNMKCRAIIEKERSQMM